MGSTLRRVVSALLLLVAGCQSAGPGFQPLPIALQLRGDIAERWKLMPPLDPRIGPEEAVGPVISHAQALVVTRRRVPAGVPGPCLALRDDAQIALEHDRWLFGLRSAEGVEVLPCIYDLLLVNDAERVTTYSRYPDTKGDTWLHGVSVLSFSQNAKYHVIVDEVPGAWFEGMPFGVTLEPGIPRAKARLACYLANGSQAFVLGERRWPWNVSHSGRGIDGVTGSDLYASFLRHDDGVLFLARGSKPLEWAVWKLDSGTGEAQMLSDSRYILAWPPPSERGWRERMEHDRFLSWEKARAYVARPSPHDASLLWLRRQTGQYEPPPGTAGVLPLVTFAPEYDSADRIAGVTDRLGPDLVPTYYERRVEQFLVAYDTEAGRMWGTASYDFETLSGPIYSQVLLEPSAELSARVNYDASVLGNSEWVLAQRASDGAWAIGSGALPDDSDFRTGIEPAQLIAQAEQRTQAEQAPLVRNAELAKKLGAQLQEQRRLAAVRERERILETYTWAMQNGSNVYGWSTATQLGGQELVNFALQLGTLSQCEQVLARGGWNDEQQSALDQHVAALKQQREAERARLVQAEQQRAASGGGGGGGGGIDWGGWRRETMNAQSANQLGLTGEAFQSYMQRYR